MKRALGALCLVAMTLVVTAPAPAEAGKFRDKLENIKKRVALDVKLIKCHVLNRPNACKF